MESFEIVIKTHINDRRKDKDHTIGLNTPTST